MPLFLPGLTHHTDAIAACGLGIIKRLICCVQQLLRQAAVIGKTGDADRNGHPGQFIGAVADGGVFDCGAQGFGKGFGVSTAGARQQDAEFLSPNRQGV